MTRLSRLSFWCAWGLNGLWALPWGGGFDNDCTQVSVSDIREYGAPPRRERVFTLDGLILLCMFSEQPVAKKVRHWLRKIGKEVAVTGSYNSPVLTQILTQLQILTSAHQNYCQWIYCTKSDASGV